MKKTNPKEKAFEKAHEIRKFEIELYWKRTTYFWAFIAVTFAGYFSVLSSEIENKETYLLLIEAIGFIFSLAWFLANKASKHWQENWEKIIDKLEFEFTGKLMQAHLKNHNKLYSLTKSYPYSVSRINQIISFFIMTIWLTLGFFTVRTMYCNSICIIKDNPLFIAIIIIVIIFTHFLLIKGRSKHDSNVEIDDIEFPPIEKE